MTLPTPPSLTQAQRHCSLALKHQGYPPEQCQAEARLLLTHITGQSTAYLLAHPEAPLTPAQWQTLQDLLQQRCQHHTPLQYLLGHTYFYGRPFTCSPAALIPRPETEYIITLALPLINTLAASTSPARVLDIGTGTGCIATTLALETSSTAAIHVSAMDISPEAITLAQHNAHTHQASVQFKICNLLTAPTPTQPYHLIVSNPPYINTVEYDALPPHIHNHEPKQALHAEENGLLFYNWFAKNLLQWLVPGGWFIGEFGTDQTKAITTLFSQHGWQQVTTHADYAGLPRMVVAQTPSNKAPKP